MELIFETLAGFTAMSGWEYLAVVLSMLYLLLAIKENIWCWPAAFVSTFIYTIMYWNGALLMESFLHFYYLAMAFVGWWMWRSGKKNEESQIVSWSLQHHVLIIIVTACAAVTMGYITDTYTHADLPYLDSLTTCFAIVTTYLVAKKVLENWLYWILIDATSMYLYYLKGYYPTLALYVFYTVMACWGYKKWYEQYTKKEGKRLAEL
ncbi:nicotinamide riboside transporter PnuC [Pseudoalteromonas luteoviolacea]|uniref:Nicotinamide riboside transporter PnuC n=1 Tax=Pseudoalteromonas luteoviolacea S4060-1 TaxID=1365257 RepID=A0A167NYJ4_9GAMM|nr:nicotinamide riboside transporter PnuC [Pseudoalteromonas luteoviolacea]KZN69100.1 nicotinamide mononucleotide transporter [Pseudoalteromonas luteoviolacea S4060-1]